MIEEIRIKGYWFLPVNKDKVVPGLLNFSPEKGVELELFGQLTPMGDFIKLNQIECILGFSIKGEKITLVHSWEFSRTTHYPGLETSWYKSEFLLIGDYFESESEIRFNKIQSTFKHLKEWLNAYSVEKVTPPKPNANPSITFNKYPPIEFMINENLGGRFRIQINIPGHHLHFDLTIDQKVLFEIDAFEPINIKEVKEVLSLFQGFLTLSAFDASYPLTVVLQNHERTNLVGKKKYPREVHLFFKQSNKKSNTSISRNDFLFQYPDVEPCFKEIIKIWFSLEPKLRPITSLLLGTFYQETSFIEDRFLNIVQGLESFHRRFRRNQHFKPKEHSELLTKVLNSVEENYRGWLSQKLAFNEPTLQTRLEELLKEFSNRTLSRMIIDQQKFIKKTKDSRNYYTHFDKKLEKKALKGEFLMNQTEKLRILLITAVLREVGFPQELIENLFTKVEYRHFNHLVGKSEM